MFLGQLLQLFYNLADTWVIGNYANNDAFAAVSSTGTIIFLIVGFFGGMATGGTVVISRFYGAKENGRIPVSIHTAMALGIIASAAATVLGLVLTPLILRIIDTPASVLPYARTYLTVYFAGVGTVVLYNICMSVMRAVGDSLHPLYYLILSSLLNVALDLLFVAHPAFQWGVFGAAFATVISQGVSLIACMIHMMHMDEPCRLHFSRLKIDPPIAHTILRLGIPAGIQNIVITLGNIVIQKNINAFGAKAMAGQGAYIKIEGFVFLPIQCMSLALPTSISANLGARRFDRAKKAAGFGVAAGVLMSVLIGILFYFTAPQLIGIFVKDRQSIELGVSYARVTTRFYCLLALAHCSAGVMRGCGKAVVPMANMLAFWCVFRILFVTAAVRIRPVFSTIAWSYPVTWGLSCIVFVYFLTRTDWVHNFEKKGRGNS